MKMLNRSDAGDFSSLRELRGCVFGGEIELCVEFPKVFDGETRFLNFSSGSTINAFYRNDAAAIEFFTGIVSSQPKIAPRGLPSDISDEVREQYAIFADELISPSGFLTQADVENLLAHYDVDCGFFNPVIEAVLLLLESLTRRYGPTCRIVFWLHEA